MDGQLKKLSNKLSEMEKKLTVKQRNDMILNPTNGAMLLTEKMLSEATWGKNTSLKMVSVKKRKAESLNSTHLNIDKMASSRTNSLLKFKKHTKGE